MISLFGSMYSEGTGSGSVAAMINFTSMDDSVHVRRRLSKKVSGWVERALPSAMEDAIVMANEMQCFEPVKPPPCRESCAACHGRVCASQGCAPLETVISIIGSGQQAESTVFKIFKPMKELEQAEVVSAVEEALAGNESRQHMTSA